MAIPTKEDLFLKNGIFFGKDGRCETDRHRIEKVTGEFAKNIAIGFEVWLRKNGWCQWDDGFVHNETDETETTDQLFNQYIKSLTQQP